MSNYLNFSKYEDILENPGLFCFRIDNNTNSFVLGKNKLNYGEKEINDIKRNITDVFQNISKEVEKRQIDNPEYLEHIVNNLRIGYNNKKKFNFPGLQVINMDREKLNYFTHWPDRFLLCEKSDGVRYLLIQYKNGICHLIGRNLEFFEIVCSEKLPPSNDRMPLNNDWSIEYFLDGELVLDDVDEQNDDKSKFIRINGEYKKINFLIFDAVVIKGFNIGFLPFRKRLEEFSKVFTEEYEVSKYIKNTGNTFLEKYNLDIQKSTFLNINKLKKEIKSIIQGTKTTSNANNKIITLYLKDYYTFEQIQKINELIKLLPHHNDGLIINVDDYPYYSGQSCEIFKWKPLEMNTIDFEIRYNENINRYILYTTYEKGSLPVEILSFASEKEKENFKKNYDSKKNIVECFYDSKLINDEVAINNYNLYNIKNENNDDISDILPSFKNKIPKNKEKYKGGWRFHKFRNDKLYPNYIKTYQNIKICIKEDIQMKEIINSLEKNRQQKLSDLNQEKNFMSALIWKKFFNKKIKNDDDDLFFDEGVNEIQNDLLNKKRKIPDDKNKEEESEDNNNYDNNNNEKDDKDDSDALDLDKLCDDDDDFY